MAEGGAGDATTNAQKRSEFLARSGEVKPAGILPLFQEEVSEVQAISPTVRRTMPAEMTPSLLLAAVEGAYSAESQTYRGLSPTPVTTMAPTPVHLPMFQHSIGKGWGSEPVGTNRKRLGDRAGPLGQTRSMPVPPSPVAYNDERCCDQTTLRVRYKTLPAGIESDWLLPGCEGWERRKHEKNWSTKVTTSRDRSPQTNRRVAS